MNPGLNAATNAAINAAVNAGAQAASAGAPRQARGYASIRPRGAAPADRDRAARDCIDALWSALAGSGVSWIGVYLKAAGTDELILGPRRDKPACSPIGLHGACGRAWRSGRSLVVRDVAALGAGYIACDPRDRSEVVVPLFDADGSCWGVIDADSYDAGAFDEIDAAGLSAVAEAFGLSCRAPAGVDVV